MTQMRFPVLLILAPLLLGGCSIGDGIAHLVKLAEKGHDGGNSGSGGQTSSAAAPAEAEPAPPAADPRPGISVETLAPPPVQKSTP